MAFPDLLVHLLNFIAPAVIVPLLLLPCGRLIAGRQVSAPVWWRQLGLNVLAGALVLVAGLVVFGRDGKMATYAALVVVCGTVQCWVAGGFRR
jgi:hypothetical protein